MGTYVSSLLLGGKEWDGMEDWTVIGLGCFQCCSLVVRPPSPLPSSKVLYTSLCFSLLIASALIGRFSECRGTPKPTLMGPAISASAHPFHSILFYSKLMDKTASFSSYSKRKREILKYRFPGSPVNTEITFASNANK